MVDINSLIGDGKESGMVTIRVETGKDSLEYDFIVDGSGNLTGAYEQEYEYMDENRMSFSIIHDQMESRIWAETYAVNVLANLIGIEDRKYSRLCIPDAELPAGGAYFRPMAISETVKKANHEYRERQKQFMRLGIEGKSPDDIFFHTLVNKDRTDIDRFISKADLAYASLTTMIALSPGFNLSDIYKTLADGMESHSLSMSDASEERREQAEPDTGRTDDGFNAYGNQDMATQPDDDDDSTPFTSLNWDSIIQDEQREIEDSGNDDGSVKADDYGADPGATGTTGMNGEDAETDVPEDAEDTGNVGAESDDEEYSSILRSNDGDDDEESLESEDEDDAEDGNEDGHHVNGATTAKTDDVNDGATEENGEEDDTEPIRDHVTGYIDGLMNDLRKDDAEQKRIMDEADKAIKDIPDKSGELEKLDTDISETKARLSSMEASRDEIAESVKESELRREDMNRRIEKARGRRDKIRADMEWLEKSKGLINK